MIKIEAAQRLLAAQADENQARAYLKSLGVEVGNVESRADNYIQFMLPFKNFDVVLQKLTKKLGRPQSLADDGDLKHLRWSLSGKGFVTLYRNQFNEVDIGISNDPRRTRANRIHAKDDNGDAERLEQLKTQIRDVEIDVKEIEEEGGDASFERRHLEKLRDEQRKLKEKKRL